MHIRQLFVASIILFGTTQMEAGRRGNQRGFALNKKGLEWAEYKKLKKAAKKRPLSKREQNALSFLRSSAENMKVSQNNLPQNGNPSKSSSQNQN